MAVSEFGPISLSYPDASPVGNKEVEVRNEDGSVAALFTSVAGAVAAPNPVITSVAGELSFYANEGVYVLTVLESEYTMTVVVYGSGGGSAGEVGEVKTQASPAATWNFTHGLGRLPTVSVYLLSGEEVETDIVASITDVTAIWPEPVAGKLVLT